jgi:hypothetical protein
MLSATARWIAGPRLRVNAAPLPLGLDDPLCVAHDEAVAQPEQRPSSITVRDALRDALAEAPHTLKELAYVVGRPESEVVEHLGHLEKTLERHKQRIEIEPAECLSCGFRFEDRRRYKRPGKCPQCKSTRLSYPRFSVPG